MIVFFLFGCIIFLGFNSVFHKSVIIRIIYSALFTGVYCIANMLLIGLCSNSTHERVVNLCQNIVSIFIMILASAQYFRMLKLTGDLLISKSHLVINLLWNLLSLIILAAIFLYILILKKTDDYVSVLINYEIALFASDLLCMGTEWICTWFINRIKEKVPKIHIENHKRRTKERIFSKQLTVSGKIKRNNVLLLLILLGTVLFIYTFIVIEHSMVTMGAYIGDYIPLPCSKIAYEDKTIEGFVVKQDGDTYYISDKNRKLVIISSKKVFITD